VPRASSPPACTRPTGCARLLRRLRVRHFSGELLDDARDDRGAAARTPASTRPSSSAGGGSTTVEAALREDMVAPRAPDRGRARARREARQLVGRAGATRARATRSSASPDGVKIAVPGFQPFAVYDVVTANLVPASTAAAGRVGRGGPRAGPGRRWPPRRWPSCATSTSRAARERLGRVADGAARRRRRLLVAQRIRLAAPRDPRPAAGPPVRRQREVADVRSYSTVTVVRIQGWMQAWMRRVPERAVSTVIVRPGEQTVREEDRSARRRTGVDPVVAHGARVAGEPKIEWLRRSMRSLARSR
jgi:hypothetical protein